MSIDYGHLARVTGKLILVIPLFAAALASIALCGMGLWRITIGVQALLGDARTTTGLASIFSGLDLLLISPMSTMIVYALYLLADAYFEGPQSPKYVLKYELAKKRLVDAKTFVLGLLATAIAIHLVEEMLSDHIKDMWGVLMYVVVIVTLGGYGLILERISESGGRQSVEEEFDAESQVVTHISRGSHR